MKIIEYSLAAVTYFPVRRLVLKQEKVPLSCRGILNFDSLSKIEWWAFNDCPVCLFGCLLTVNPASYRINSVIKL